MEGYPTLCPYGVFGENGTQDVSKGRNGLFQNSNLFFFTIFFLVLIF